MNSWSRFREIQAADYRPQRIPKERGQAAAAANPIGASIVAFG